MVSSTTSFKAIASFFSVFAVTNAHMIMKTPIPYGRGVIDSSPLKDDGSDYPCKNIFDMTDSVNDVNHLVPGVANTLSFTGSAVHGGGSCQVSLTTDLKPTKNSKWMVIQSIEGGCPANVAGNLPADPNGSGASTFQYTVPQGFPAGDYTIAWSWFNKIGNREMYMNCGRAKIANSKKRYAPAAPKIEHRAADYPDLFKAQLAIFSCKVPEGINVAFPNPGAAVQTIGQVSSVACGGGGNNPAPTGGNAGNGGSSAAATATGGAATTTGRAATTSAAGGRPSGFATGGNGGGASTTAAAGGRSTSRPGVFVPSASPSSAPAATDSPAEPTAAASVTATVQPIPQPTPSSGSGNGNGSTSPVTGSNTAGSPCSQEGAWACSSDGKSFQRCASGMWSAPMAVAAGTSCVPGTSMDLSMKVVGRKRDQIAHLHRRRSGHHVA